MTAGHFNDDRPGRSPDEVVRLQFLIAMVLIGTAVAGHVAGGAWEGTWYGSLASNVPTVLIVAVALPLVLQALAPVAMLVRGTWRLARRLVVGPPPRDPRSAISRPTPLGARVRHALADSLAVRLLVTALVLLAVQGVMSAVR